MWVGAPRAWLALREPPCAGVGRLYDSNQARGSAGTGTPVAAL
jgi:hypothetical protein